jgi:hypothetical protein
MPAGAIEDQDDPLGWSCSHISGKGGEHLAEEGSRDGGQEPPLGLPRRGTDEATDIQPLVALLDGRDGSLADGCPDLPDQGKQPNPMLIGGPELDLRLRMRCPDLGYPIAELC